MSFARKGVRFAIVAGTLVFPPVFGSGASAAPCAGFVDVEDTSAFCRNVEWMKNRGITLGCGGNLYCPGEVVTRLAMAVFLRRLGNVLTPVPLVTFDNGAVVDLDAGAVLCQTANHVVTSPRTAHGVASLLGGEGGGPADFAVRFVESTDNGATWNPVSPSHAATVSPNHRENVAAALAPRDLQTGTSYRYGLRVARVAGSTTTTDLSFWQCHLRVLLENRNPTSSPFDAGL